MSDAEPSLPGEGLVYEDCLPLRVSALEAEVVPSRMLAIQESNEELLRIVAALDEHHTVEGSEDDAAHHGQDLARIESKLDLLLDLMAHVLTGQLAVPPALPVRFNADAIQWLQPQVPPEAGQRVLLDLYLHRKVPRPLVLPGVVHEVQAEEGGWRVTVRFEDMHAAVRDWLEKIIFRQHRRSVAEARARRQRREEEDERTSR